MLQLSRVYLRHWLDIRIAVILLFAIFTSGAIYAGQSYSLVCTYENESDWSADPDGGVFTALYGQDQSTTLWLDSKKTKTKTVRDFFVLIREFPMTGDPWWIIHEPKDFSLVGDPEHETRFYSRKTKKFYTCEPNGTAEACPAVSRGN